MLAEYRYGYDAAGNRVQKEGLCGTTRYGYDALYRLTEEEGARGTECYTYDRAGNRLSRTGPEQREEYRYDASGRLAERLVYQTAEHREDKTNIIQMPGTGRPGMEVPGKTAERSLAGEFGSAFDRNPAMPGCITPEEPDLHLISRYQYQYDAQGNVTGDGENRYRYDSRNRLTEIETKDGGIQRNRYDGEGLRAELEENGELTRFLFSGREVVAEEKEEHTVIRYIRGIELLSSDCESARTYYHYACDELGSVTHVTDASGEVLNRYTYDAFGNRTSIEETVENRFGFTGELLDGLTGQYYLRARFYSPAIGRFLQEDTYYGDGLNLYSYCQNNPVKYVDPSGHNGCPKEGLMEGKEGKNRPEPEQSGSKKNAEGGSGSKFKYEHNPSDNPKVLEDVIEDPNAVYGYRPSKTGSVKAFADDDWSDIDLVNNYREKRIKYHQENDINIEIANSMRSEGRTDSEIARALVERRNSNRLASYIDENGDIIDINKYNQALEHCKTYDELRKGNAVKAGKTDLEIIESSTKGNPGFDACTGLYDIYFNTYGIEE